MMLKGKKRAALEKFIPLQLCKSGTPPEEDGWIHEIKLDGYRIEAVKDNGTIHLLSRNQIDWTDRFARIEKSLRDFPAKSAVLDGEVVALDQKGISRFQILQNAMDLNQSIDLIYYIIDMMYYDGYDIRHVPLLDRKILIQNIVNNWVEKPDNIRVSDFMEGQGQIVLKKACAYGLEGIISKRAHSFYHSKRTADWIKAKCLFEEEFVIGGFSDPKGSREYFGSLALGFFRNDQLVYCGNVGTGFSESLLKKLYGMFAARTRKTCPFAIKPPLSMHWLKPDLVAQIRFAEWTHDGLLRQPVFLGLRHDKAAKDVKKSADEMGSTEQNSIKAKSHVSSKTNVMKVANVVITNPEKKLYTNPNISKLELASFYFEISDWILPYIKNRPLSLYRCPQGVSGKCFFQKHFVESLPDGVFPVHVIPTDEPYITIKDARGLVSLVQMGVLEIHPWNSRTPSLTKPDQMIFDLDPAADVAFEKVKECARLLRDLLQTYSLESFVKTTGGKGLHVVVPLKPMATHDEVTKFAKDIADYLVFESPHEYVATMSKSKRVGKIFIDYLRNPKGATAIAPYCARARIGGPIAIPLLWDELRKLDDSKKYTIKNLLTRLKHLKKDPWEDFFKVKQKLPKFP